MNPGSESFASDVPWSLYSQASANAVLSSSASRPPSPAATILSWQKEKHAASPNDPTGLPRYIAPCACAQSSITMTRCSWASSMMGSISAGQPATCTTMTAAVCSVSTAASVSAVRSELSGSMSANTGVAPSATTQLAVAMKLRAGTTTSACLLYTSD